MNLARWRARYWEWRWQHTLPGLLNKGLTWDDVRRHPVHVAYMRALHERPRPLVLVAAFQYVFWRWLWKYRHEQLDRIVIDNPRRRFVLQQYLAAGKVLSAALAAPVVYLDYTGSPGLPKDVPLRSA